MRTRLGHAVVIAAIAAALPLSAAPAGAGVPGSSTPTVGATPRSAVPAEVADKPFVFFGSGWGHGVGLSQWGAYGLAQDGWSHQRILAHFYSGTDVGPASAKQA